MSIREKIFDVLEANGIYVENGKDSEDLDLREYIADSIQFINFIVELERELDIEFPDEALLFDNIVSLNGFVTILESIVSGTWTMPDKDSGKSGEEAL
jgi:acyl carrier protein